MWTFHEFFGVFQDFIGGGTEMLSPHVPKVDEGILIIFEFLWGEKNTGTIAANGLEDFMGQLGMANMKDGAG